MEARPVREQAPSNRRICHGSLLEAACGRRVVEPVRAESALPKSNPSLAPDRRPVGGRLRRAKGGRAGSRASSLQQADLPRVPVGGRLRAKGGRTGSRGIRPPTVESIAGTGSDACGRPAVPGEGWPGRFASKLPPTGGSATGPCWRPLAGEGWAGRFAQKSALPQSNPSPAPDRTPVGGRLCRAKGGPAGSRASSLQQADLSRVPVGGRLRAKGGRTGSRGIRPPKVEPIARAGSKACGRPAPPGEGWSSRFASKLPPTGGSATGPCWRPLAGEGWSNRFARNPPSHSRIHRRHRIGRLWET